jgi:hypothetical protein
MGFNPIFAPYSVGHVFAADPAADESFSILRFPAIGFVQSAYVTNTATVVAGAGTSLALRLTKYSNAATPVLQGTLGAWASSAAWGVDIPKAMTVTSFGSTALFAAGEWVRLDYDETATGTWTELGFQCTYVLGTDGLHHAGTPSAGTGPA